MAMPAHWARAVSVEDDIFGVLEGRLYGLFLSMAPEECRGDDTGWCCWTKKEEGKGGSAGTAESRCSFLTSRRGIHGIHRRIANK
jgi:hypothetical protein